MAHAGGRRGALGDEHERPPRQAAADQGQGRRHHPADFNKADYGTGGAYTIPPGNLFPLVGGHAAGEDEGRGLRDGLPEPVPAADRRERRRVRQRLLARLAQSAAVPRGSGRGPLPDRPAPGELRVAVLLREEPGGVPVEREPAGADEPQQPPAGARRADPAALRLRQSRRCPEQRLLEPERRPERRAGPRGHPAAHRAGHLVLVRRQPGGQSRWGRRASRPTARTLREHRFRGRPRSVRDCSPSSTPTASARTGSRSTATTRRTRTRRSSRRTTTTRWSWASSRRTRCAS